MILSYIVSCAFFLCLVQANLELLFDDAFCKVQNTEYIDPDCSIEISEDSEYGNSLSVHLEILKKLPSLKASAKVLGMERSGEYTQDVGLSVTMDICESLAGPPNIADVFVKALNLKSGECPPEPGVYGEEHFVIDTDGNSGLPDSFPGGKYLLNMSILTDGNETLAELDIFLMIM
ncbi:uncharacterized protein LOC143213503 [Lasioglossum baleicum]|uniref:uncharacterized protein LOC143213503 n=1 Tax=Lasioglossum baleicum TaxID=434251 RepID=UPI003FCDB64E